MNCSDNCAVAAAEHPDQAHRRSQSNKLPMPVAAPGKTELGSIDAQKLQRPARQFGKNAAP